MFVHTLHLLCLTAGCLPVEQVRTVYDDLMKGQQGLVLATDLHLLFLTTPPDLCTSIRPNWMIYFEKVIFLVSVVGCV